jgi:CheY-like chemotaxis protein
VASDSPTEVTLVRSLLKHEFTDIIAVSSEEDWRMLLQRNDVAALVLAFNSLAAARDFHRRYVLAMHSAAANAAQAVMLCSLDNVPAAYDLCRGKSISDHVLFWPMTHDPRRLPLAVHRACDAFECLLPAVTPSPATISGPVPPADTAMPPLDLQVLVVEDHGFQLAVAVSVLISAGLRATGASDAQAALAMIETSMPGLILLDVDMPGMGGMELLRLLKATPRLASIPVIMLTVTREREMVLEALRDGAADFIVKPFDRDTLLQKIRRVAGHCDAPGAARGQ